MNSRRPNPITGRYAPSEEYRRKLRQRHIVEGICIFISITMIGLCLAFAMDFNRGMWIPEVVILLGVILNFTLAIRAILMKQKMFFAGLLLSCVVCLGGLGYLMWT